MGGHHRKSKDLADGAASFVADLAQAGAAAATTQYVQNVDLDTNKPVAVVDQQPPEEVSS